MRKQIWAVRNHEDHVEVVMSHVLNFPASSPAPPTQNTGVFVRLGREMEGRDGGKKRADCSEPEQGQSSSVTLVLGQAELCSTWEPNHAYTHKTVKGKTEWEQRWVWSDQAAEFRVRKRETETSFNELSLKCSWLAEKEAWNLLKTPERCFLTWSLKPSHWYYYYYTYRRELDSQQVTNHVSSRTHRFYSLDSHEEHMLSD